MTKCLKNATIFFTIAINLTTPLLSHASERVLEDTAQSRSRSNSEPEALQPDFKPLTIKISNYELGEEECYFSYAKYKKTHPMGITVHGVQNEYKDLLVELGLRVSAFFPEKGKDVEITYMGSRMNFSIDIFYATDLWKPEDDKSPGSIFYGINSINITGTTDNAQELAWSDLSKVHLSLCKDSTYGIGVKILESF